MKRIAIYCGLVFVCLVVLHFMAGFRAAFTHSRLAYTLTVFGFSVAWIQIAGAATYLFPKIELCRVKGVFDGTGSDEVLAWWLLLLAWLACATFLPFDSIEWTGYVSLYESTISSQLFKFHIAIFVSAVIASLARKPEKDELFWFHYRQAKTDEEKLDVERRFGRR